ncbi:uncharacterized protein DUF4269 [Chitinophaga skermanii]|uniref:Uncharacterized protein DUF4269 n=1 Tax=Chitinophaga skermanii TaxID=331697 RepID=A0A327R3M2_9BACT|nr:DUF4269 domain-containing protein [Chitinophaga skermanii]RAJ08477.1 uncharacterized protein DUF4269 [Chitinophaga skermanii]
MENQFLQLAYLQDGNTTQQAAFDCLQQHQVFQVLADFQPILVGTIPIQIDIPGSDLDIICSTSDTAAFVDLMWQQFASMPGFQVKEFVLRGQHSVVANFLLNGMPVEIFAQNTPTTLQFAYIHMLVEDAIIREKGEDFRQSVINLKKAGLKTEPAFAELLGLNGDPYEALYELYFASYQ